jgi:hypothetical protein
MVIIDSRGRPVSRPRKQSQKSATALPDEERAQLIEIVNAAVKADRRQFGRPDCGRIAVAILPRLTATQVSLLRDGAFGDVMARTIICIEQKRHH